MYILFTTYKVTASYQYMSALCYRGIHLLMFICSDCAFIYKKYVILLCFIINHHQNLLNSKNCINFFVIFCNTMFCYIKVHLWSPKIFDHRQKAKFERWGSIRGRPTVVRDIVTLVYIVWIQWFLGNTLLKPTSVSYFPGPENDVLSVVIIDLISRSALVGFSLLCARY